MKAVIIFVVSFGISFSLFSNTEVIRKPLHGHEVRELLPELESKQAEALLFLHSMEPYDPSSYNGLTYDDLYIAAGSREIADACFTLLEDVRFQHYWRDAYHALGLMASVGPDRVDFDRITEMVRRLEESDLDENLVVNTLGMGYIAVSRFGNERSEVFLAPRMKERFWDEKRKLEQDWAVHNQPPEIFSARELAVMNFNSLGEESGVERLKELLANERDEGGEALEKAIGIVKRTSPVRRARHERNLALYREWQDIQPESEVEADLPDDGRGFQEEAPEETEALDAPDESRDPDSEEYPETLRHTWLYGVVIAFVGVLGVILLWCVAKIRSR